MLPSHIINIFHVHIILPSSGKERRRKPTKYFKRHFVLYFTIYFLSVIFTLEIFLFIALFFKHDVFKVLEFLYCNYFFVIQKQTPTKVIIFFFLVFNKLYYFVYYFFYFVLFTLRIDYFL